MKSLTPVFLLACILLACNRPENPGEPEEPGEPGISVTLGGNELGDVSVEEVGFTSARVEASWIAFGSELIVQYGFVWGPDNDPQPGNGMQRFWNDNPKLTVGLNKVFSHTIFDLVPNEEYWVRTYMKTENGATKLGNAIPFTTLGIPPVVETGPSISVDATEFTVTGTIISTGSGEITEFGHIASLSGPPSINSDLKEPFTGAVPDGFEFENTFTGLQEGKTYFYNTYAFNESGSFSLGDPRTIKTEAVPSLYVESMILVSDHGNLDGKVNRGEELEYLIKVKNSGSLAANGAKLELLENSPYVSSITPNLIELGTVPGGSTQAIDASDIRIQVDPFANWDSTVNIQLLLSDQEGRFWQDTLSFFIESSFVVTDGLLAYYTFDRDDQSGIFTNSELNNTTYPGVKNNNPTYSTDVPALSGNGYSLQFSSGQKNYINIGNSPIHARTKRTFSMWIKTNVGGDYLLFEKRNYDPWVFFSLQNGFRFYYNISLGSETVKSFGISTQTVTDGEWHMLTVTRNGSSHRLFIDGLLVSTISDSYVQTGSNEGLAIGAKVRAQSSEIEAPFQGKMDNIRFYNRPLNSEEIFELYQKRQ